MLIRMSIQAGLGIATVLLVKKYLNAWTKKKTAVFLWDMLLVRLLVPIELILEKLGIDDVFWSTVCAKTTHEFTGKSINIALAAQKLLIREMFCVVWLIVAGLIMTVYIYRYFQIRQVFENSIPMEENTAVRKFFCKYTEYKKIPIAYSLHVLSPVAGGILHPKILLPMSMAAEETGSAETILLHECIHIKRGDPQRKWLIALASAIHWFNPLVWAMVFAANRDIEHCCDELVLTRIGAKARADYANMLVAFEEKMMYGPWFASALAKKPIKERVFLIMNYHEITPRKKIVSALVSALAACLLAAGAMIGSKEIYGKNAAVKRIIDVGEAAQIQPITSLASENLNAGEYKIKIRIKNKGFDYGQGLSVWCSNENSKDLIYSGQIKHSAEIEYQTIEKKNCRFYVKCESSDPIELERFELMQ